MVDFNRRPQTDTGDVATIIHDFLRALQCGNRAAVRALCRADAEFTMERPGATPVTVWGPETFTRLAAPRPGFWYTITPILLRPAVDGAILVWRARLFGRGGASRLLGVTVFQLPDGRISRMESTYSIDDAAEDGDF